MPLRVFVVEDEVAISLLIEDAVEALGHTVAHTATNIREAMHLAATAQFDVALLDLNLNGQKAHALPIALKARGSRSALSLAMAMLALLPSLPTLP